MWNLFARALKQLHFVIHRMDYTTRKLTQCTNLAISSLETPPVIHTGSFGRPRLQISRDALTQ